VWTATTARYIDAFERLTGTDFVPGRYPAGPRIHAALAGLEIYS
jgi:phosphoribosylaminoimidazole-succinocarboxamide synthase